MRKPRFAWPALAFLLLAGVSRAGDAPVVGFTPEGLAAQRALEARYDALLDAKNLRAWMERLSSRPHHLGSPWGKQNAEFVAGLFRSWGYDTRIEEYEVLFPTPEGAGAGDGVAHALRGPHRGAHPGRRPHVGPEGRAASHLQRVFRGTAT